MLQIERVKLELDEEESLLGRKAAAILRLPQEELRELRILRKAVDAREGVRFVYTLQAAVKNPNKVRRNRGYSRRRRRSTGCPPPSPLPGPGPWWWARGPGGSSAPWPWPGAARRPSCWSGGGT